MADTLNRPIRADTEIGWMRSVDDKLAALARGVFTGADTGTDDSYIEQKFATPVGSVIFNSLNGDLEGIYDIIYDGVITTAGVARSIVVRPNGDAAPGNYFGQGLYTEGTTISPMNFTGATYTGAFVGNTGTTATELASGSIRVYAATGKRRDISAETIRDSAFMFRTEVRWTNTATNVNSIELNFGGGTFVGTVSLRKARSGGIQGPKGDKGDAGVNASAQSYTTTIGNGTLTTFTIAHGLGSSVVNVTVRETASPYRVFEPVVSVPDNNTVTLDFATPPTAGQFRVDVLAGYNPGTPVSNLPSYDSGWYADEANTSHITTITHNLGINLQTDTPRIGIWFAPTNPASGAPTFIAPVSVRSMWVDDPASTGMGYNNPTALLMKVNTLEYHIYSGLGLFCYWEAPGGAWRMYQTGYIRVKIWRNS